jgi:hypothetical protein
MPNYEDRLHHIRAAVLPEIKQVKVETGETSTAPLFPAAYKVYLVNEGDHDLTNVAMYTGGFEGTSETLVELNRVGKSLGPLMRGEALFLEEFDYWMLDFVLWYHGDPCINVLLGISADRRGRNRVGKGAGTGTDSEGERWPSLERKPIDRVRARLEALLKANAAPRCGARSKRTGKPCRGAAMPNGRCKFHGGKSTGPRTPEGLARSRRANWKHGHFSREAKAERSRVRAAILALRDLCDSI